ncbi:dihydrodipicolinate synthase family protein [Streptomyces sp. B6B3]|uniref:dihydrodipicolinate synthase family protein n=1 Tax=Streptomyces sp. B6B3 TaxID=3153570 RepID=UPI00325EBE22
MTSRHERPPARRDGRELLAGLVVPLVTPMRRPGVPSARAAKPLLAALAEAGARGLMLFGSNGEGPLLPTTALGAFASGVTRHWRGLTAEPATGPAGRVPTRGAGAPHASASAIRAVPAGGAGPVLINVTAAGTAEALARAEAVLPARPDALVLSPPIYFHHREDEILAHYAAFADLGVPVVAYNAPRYSCPLTPALIDALATLDHVVGLKDSSGDVELLAHAVAAARRHPGFGVSQGAEGQLLAGLRLGAHGIVPGIANLAPGPGKDLLGAHHAGRDEDAERAQRLIDELTALHRVRSGVPSVKAILHARGLCPPHTAAPFTPCTDAEREALLTLLSPHDPHLLHAAP